MIRSLTLNQLAILRSGAGDGTVPIPVDLRALRHFNDVELLVILGLLERRGATICLTALGRECLARTQVPA